MATPSGIDHDYNFISGIERAVIKTDEQLRAKNIGAGIDRLRPNRHGQLGTYQPRSSDDRSALARRLEERRVIVEKAPLGMSRQRSNRSRILKKWVTEVAPSSTKANTILSKQLLWTVEWLMHDDTCHLDEVLEDVPISLAYSQLMQRKANKAYKAEKRKREVKPDDETSVLRTLPQPPQATGEDVHSHDAISQAQAAGAEERVDLAASDVDDAKPQSAQDSEGNSPAQSLTVVPSDVHFYLVKPQTRGSRHVLIPLQPEDTLETCLGQQVVLEFPSIQVLPQSAEQLSGRYVLETDYFKSSQLVSTQAGLPHTDALSSREDREHDNGAAQVALNEQKLLEVLKQDLG